MIDNNSIINQGQDNDTTPCTDIVDNTSDYNNNNENENIYKPDVTVNIDTENIAKKLDTIARRLDSIPDEPIQNKEKLNYYGKKDDKSIRADDGHKLKDYELYRIVLERIQEKERETGIKVPISHEFRQYMADYVKEVGSGLKTDAEFKSERLENDVDINRVDIDSEVLKNKKEG